MTGSCDHIPAYGRCTKCGAEFPSAQEDAQHDYRSKVNYGLLTETVELFQRLGVVWADDNPERRTAALAALERLADAIAGSLTP